MRAPPISRSLSSFARCVFKAGWRTYSGSPSSPRSAGSTRWRSRESAGEEQAVAVLQHRLADMARRLHGDLAGARALAEASLETHRRNGFRKGETQALTALADIELAEGRPELALELLHESARIAEEIGFRWWLSGARARIGSVCLALGRLEEAAASTREALAISAAIRDRRAIVAELVLLAEIVAASGSPQARRNAVRCCRGRERASAGGVLGSMRRTAPSAISLMPTRSSRMGARRGASCLSTLPPLWLRTPLAT